MSKTITAISQNVTTTISLDVPEGSKEVLAVIPYGYWVAADWNTRLQFGKRIGASTFDIRPVGNTAQGYTIYYYVLYK